MPTSLNIAWAYGRTGATIKAAPPIAVSSWYLFGHSMEQWVVIATLIYTLLLIVGQVYKIYKDVTRG